MGRDVMTGNGGIDGFYWYSTAETGDNNNDADVVTDFVAGVDKLFVSPIDANVTNADPDDRFEFIGDAAPPVHGSRADQLYQRRRVAAIPSSSSIPTPISTPRR